MAALGVYVGVKVWMAGWGTMPGSMRVHAGCAAAAAYWLVAAAATTVRAHLNNQRLPQVCMTAEAIERLAGG